MTTPVPRTPSGGRRPRVALVTATDWAAVDPELAPLTAAVAAAGLDAVAVAWDDPDAAWGAFDLAVVRSTWDYDMRSAEFLAWLGRAGAATNLANPPAVVRWNADKHYLRDLVAAGVATVPTVFVAPGDRVDLSAPERLGLPAGTELVVKPAVSAGARNTARYAPGERAAATAHARRLLDAGAAVMVQPYQAGVDAEGERALVFLGGRISHAIRKGPVLRPGEGPDAVHDTVDGAHPNPVPHTPTVAELTLADAALAAAAKAAGVDPGGLLYARVDVTTGDDGTPVLMELELIEPYLFLDHADGAVERFAAAIAARAVLRGVPAGTDRHAGG